MAAVVSLLLVIALSLLVVRVGTIALVMTGLSEDVAGFQALSAFSGAGFTTDEAERVVSTPPRRRIVALLIRLGSAGIVTAISALMLSFIGAEGAQLERLAVLVLGGLTLIALARSRAFGRLLTPLIERVLRRYTTLDVRDYADLLHLRKDYRIAEIEVEPASWLAARRLGALNLADEGVRVLGVVRASGSYVGAPPPELRLAAGDRLLLYGRAHRVRELSGRHESDLAAHDTARSEHEQDLARQRDHERRHDAPAEPHALPSDAPS